MKNGNAQEQNWGHDEAILQCGFKYRKEANSTDRIRFMVDVEKDDGTFVKDKSPTPMMLAEDGTDNRDGPPFFLRVSKYREEAWGGLGLPTIRPPMGDGE